MKICVVYHSIFSGGSLPISTSFACDICHEQMRALKQSGLMDACDEMHVGINGPEDDISIARLFIPSKAKFIAHGAGATTEIPTMEYLRKWLPGHEDWYVMYHHLKAVSHPGQELFSAWRRRLEKAVVWNWKRCVADLSKGTDAVGAHWLTPEQFPTLVHGTPFFGGTFWWAKARYLMTLPPLPPATWANRFEAEHWIGKRRPMVVDYCPGWP